MKKVFLVALAVMLVTGLTGTVMAKGPGGEIVTINWLEDATRYYPDDTVWGLPWVNDSLGPADLVRTGKAYHFADIGDYYIQMLPDVTGSLAISGSGRLSGHSKYTSLASGLPIKERFKGQVTIDPVAGTMEGTYTQWAYAFGTWDQVKVKYPKAVPEGKRDTKGSGWWFIGYTEYEAHS